MARKTYAAALNEVLFPIGFKQEEKKLWSRYRGEWKDEVEIYTVQYLGTHASLATKNLATLALLHEAIPGYDATFGHKTPVKDLETGLFGCWRDDPEDLAKAVAVQAEPFFAQFQTVEGEVRLYRLADLRGHPPEHIFLAINLYRAGKLDEAREVMNFPPRRTSHPAWLKRAETLRGWLDRQAPTHA